MKTFLAFISSLFLVFILASCSDDDEVAVTAKKSTQTPRFDHSHGKEVTDLEKHKFEHQFADQCVEREIKNSQNKNVDRQRYSRPCLCIAAFMMKDLTATEAEKFLKEHKNTQSLRIRYENAAYHCLQEKAQAKAPTVFRQR